ncbi:MAG: adenine deaminase [Myxococcota bacterium]
MNPRHRRIRIGRGDEDATRVLANARVLDVFSGTWMTGDIAIADGTIAGIGSDYRGAERYDCGGRSVVPGFIDSHVHIESTLMLPHECGKAVLPRGTTTSIWDPHEIGNVFGLDGLHWAADASMHTPLDLFVMASSCVPSSPLESPGAEISAAELETLRSHPRVIGLAEMMNFPGVLNGDPEVLAKLDAFETAPRDGHAPMMTGRDLCAYIAAGIRTDHECTSLEEAREKLQRGMRVLIREGSVAKNADALLPLLNVYSSPFVSFCTDDRNPLDIAKEGHIDFIARSAISSGVAPEVVFRSASISAALQFRLQDRGAIAPGYLADLVVLDDVDSVSVVDVFKSGRRVGEAGWDWGHTPAAPRENSMNTGPLSPDDLRISASSASASVHVIEVIPGQIVTGRGVVSLPVRDGSVQVDGDVLKLAVFERHRASGRVGVSFVRGFGFREGAVASSVAHDAHNLCAVGATDGAIVAAARAVNEMGGGIAVVNGSGRVLASLSLPVAGLMSPEGFTAQVAQLTDLHAAARSLGGVLDEPFLQLSFLALPVIPTLKLTDLGLVDVDAFKVIPTLAA